MNQYRIEAYDGAHDGRPRVDYQWAGEAAEAAEQFHMRHPARVIRAIWEFVPPQYWNEYPAPETDPNSHLEETQ